MKFIFSGDWHLSAYSQDPIIKGMPERLHYLMIVLNDMAKYAIDNGIDKIVVAGDIFHTKSVIHAIAQSLLLDYIEKFSQITFIVIDGNHDVSSKSGTGISALKCLDSVPNVRMIHTQEQIENVLFVAWTDQLIPAIKKGKADYLVSHFGLNEAQLSSGISIVSDLGLKDVNQYKHVLLGHYHKPQEVSNVWYVGSPIQLDWGEKHEDKRFLVVDSDNDTIESVLIDGYKRHYEFELTKETQEEILKQVEKLKGQGHDIKLKLMTDGVDIDSIPDDLRVIDKREKDITNRGLDSSMSKSDILTKYLEIKEIKPEEMKDYMDVGLKLIDECNME